MSDCRERVKAKKLTKLLDKHSLIIAFDSCLIILEIIKKLIVEKRQMSDRNSESPSRSSPYRYSL